MILLEMFLVSTGVGRLFFLTAMLGGLLFVVQWTLVLFGLHADGSDLLSFKWLSLQALTGFLLFFGSCGLTALYQFHWSPLFSLSLALIGGLCAVAAAASLLHLLQKLKSTGTVFVIEKTLGYTGVVYQRISKTTPGKVSLHFEGITYEIDATSIEEEIPSFTPVRIIQIHDPRTVVVKPIGT